MQEGGESPTLEHEDNSTEGETPRQVIEKSNLKTYLDIMYPKYDIEAWKKEDERSFAQFLEALAIFMSTYPNDGQADQSYFERTAQEFEFNSNQVDQMKSFAQAQETIRREEQSPIGRVKKFAKAVGNFFVRKFTPLPGTKGELPGSPPPSQPTT